MILKSHNLDKWVAKYFVSKMKHIEILKKHRKDTEKCTIQYLFSMSVSFPYLFSIFSVSEFFIGIGSVSQHFLAMINTWHISTYSSPIQNFLIKGASTSTAQGHLWRDHKID